MFDKIEFLTKRVLKPKFPKEMPDGSLQLSKKQMTELLRDGKLAIQQNWPVIRVGLAIRVHAGKHSENATIGRVGAHKYIVLL